MVKIFAFFEILGKNVTEKCNKNKISLISMDRILSCKLKLPFWKLSGQYENIFYIYNFYSAHRTDE
jgi:hypothetical protein